MIQSGEGLIRDAADISFGPFTSLILLTFIITSFTILKRRTYFNRKTVAVGTLIIVIMFSILSANEKSRHHSSFVLAGFSISMS